MTASSEGCRVASVLSLTTTFPDLPVSSKMLLRSTSRGKWDSLCHSLFLILGGIDSHDIPFTGIEYSLLILLHAVCLALYHMSSPKTFLECLESLANHPRGRTSECRRKDFDSQVILWIIKERRRSFHHTCRCFSFSCEFTLGYLTPFRRLKTTCLTCRMTSSKWVNWLWLFILQFPVPVSQSHAHLLPSSWKKNIITCSLSLLHFHF